MHVTDGRTYGLSGQDNLVGGRLASAELTDSVPDWLPLLWRPSKMTDKDVERAILQVAVQLSFPPSCFRDDLLFFFALISTEVGLA